MVKTKINSFSPIVQEKRIQPKRSVKVRRSYLTRRQSSQETSCKKSGKIFVRKRDVRNNTTKIDIIDRTVAKEKSAMNSSTLQQYGLEAEDDSFTKEDEKCPLEKVSREFQCEKFVEENRKRIHLKHVELSTAKGVLEGNKLSKQRGAAVLIDEKEDGKSLSNVARGSSKEIFSKISGSQKPSRFAEKSKDLPPRKSKFKNKPASSSHDALINKHLETIRKICQKLHASEIPLKLPCREDEFNRICSFVMESIGQRRVSQAMYISGVPGTGKTATTIQAIRSLKSRKGVPKFDFVSVNAMELADPKFIFLEIYKELFPMKKVSSLAARRLLNTIFGCVDAKRPPLILLVDELDLLCTKRQDFMYDIFNWSANEESGVSVIAIANTLDLPERFFTQRVASRLGANRLCFQPYDHDEIAAIIKDRLCGTSAVEAEVIELASRKVAAVSGDLRKALDMVRRSAEIALDSNRSKITMKDVQEAIREASNTPRVELVCSLSKHGLLLLRSALAEQTALGLEEFLFSDLFKQYLIHCHTYGYEPLPATSAYRIVLDMCSSRLLVAAPGNGISTKRLRLGLTPQDLIFSLNQVDKNDASV